MNDFETVRDGLVSPECGCYIDHHPQCVGGGEAEPALDRIEAKVARLQVIEAGFRAAYEPSQGEDDWYNRRLPLIRAAQDALKEVDDEGR